MDMSSHQEAETVRPVIGNIRVPSVLKKATPFYLKEVELFCSEDCLTWFSSMHPIKSKETLKAKIHNTFDIIWSGMPDLTCSHIYDGGTDC